MSRSTRIGSVALAAIGILLMAGCPNLFGPRDGDPDPTGNVRIENYQPYELIVHVGSWNEVSYTDSTEVMATDAIAAGAVLPEVAFPTEQDFNIWYTHMEGNTRIWTRLVSDASTTVFHLDEGSEYVLMLGVGDLHDKYQFYELVEGTGTTLPPEISPVSGTYASPPTVSITCPTPEAVIYYTTNGTTPTTGSTLYTGPFILADSGTVSAIAQADGLEPSIVVSEFYTVESGSGGGDTEPPVVTEFVAEELSYDAEIDIDTLTGTDDTAITKWLITETSAQPSAGDSGWSFSVPQTYTVAAPGTYTLYAWAKDYDDNVSELSAESQAAVEYREPMFQDVVTSHPEAPLYRMAVGDVNNDGRDDVVGVDVYESPVYVLLQDSDADGGLLDATELPLPVAGDSATSIDIGDINDDGLNDIVICSRYGNYIGYYLQSAGGGFEAGASFQAPEPNYSDDFYIVRVGDVTNDGRDDIVVLLWYGTNGTTLHVFTQTEANTINTTPAEYYVDHGGKGDVMIADVNNDSRLDVVVESGQSFSPQLTVLTQAANGTLNAGVEYELSGVDDPESFPLARGLAIGDINDDDLPEVVLSHGWYDDDSVISIFEQGPTPGPLNSSYTNVFVERSPESIVIADLNLDGLDDIFYEKAYSYDMVVYLQQPGGTLVREQIYQLNDNVDQWDVGDFNNDGLPDIIAGSSLADDGVFIYYQRP